MDFKVDSNNHSVWDVFTPESLSNKLSPVTQVL